MKCESPETPFGAETRPRSCLASLKDPRGRGTVVGFLRAGSFLGKCSYVHRLTPRRGNAIIQIMTTAPTNSAGAEFRTITIVSLGLIGGSLALAFRRSGFAGKLIGVSREETLQSAKRQRIIDEGFTYGNLCEAASQADLVILAGPIHVVRQHLQELGKQPDKLRPGTLITDVGSTKQAILEDAERFLPSSVHFIGGHPMAGSEKSGLDAADAFLFQNAYYALTPAKGVPPDLVDGFVDFLSRTGARLVILDAKTHDCTAGAISHLPQLIAVALVNYLDELGDNRELGVRLAAGGFRDMTRIASSRFDMWRDIFATNSTAARDALANFIQYLSRSSDRIGTDSLREDFDRAAETRAAIPSDSKGFLHPLREILVVVEDKPGVIAEISNVLAEDSINILDIEVLKVREGEGGTLRLAFASLPVAEQAIELLTKKGYAVRMRQ